MKLYFAPMTCSLSPHIVLRELGLPFDLIRVNNQTKRTADGNDFMTINPKGYVAALVLDGDEVLTEGAVIVQYLADLVPGNSLAPANGSWQRVRLQEWLNYITAEIHSGCAPLFNRDLPEPTQQWFKQKLFKRLDYLSQTLAHQHYLMGSYGLADIYLFTVLGWLPFFGIDLHHWPLLAAYRERIAARPSVKLALAAEAASAAVG
ncbi:glutathione transferase GstA [Pseudomonas sp. PS01297]|uniref:glutathione transferase GstA n=1 Tax=Pseudomonas sp. PS01297 TaxID=2991433 RepID=UPI00249BA2D0|nr:glutathione transferase GstA [Pseudomonas sp. PS01297]